MWLCVWPSEKKLTLSTGNVRCVQNNAEQMPKYVILSNNSSLFSVTAVHLCAYALLSCRVSLNNDAIYFDCVLIVYLALKTRLDLCLSVGRALLLRAVWLSQMRFLLQWMDSPQKCVANECVSAIWRMEEDDVTIREQNFHSQVREYIVSTERLMKSDRVCLPCCSLSHLASIASISWNDNISIWVYSNLNFW